MKGARILALALIVGIGWMSDLKADYREHYRKALNLIDRGYKWMEAGQSLQQAIKEQPNEGGPQISISSFFSRPYLPHYYLGLALFKNKDCKGALSQWQISEKQGVLQKWTEQYEEMKKDRASCPQQVAAPSSPVPPPLSESASLAPVPAARAADGGSKAQQATANGKTDDKATEGAIQSETIVKTTSPTVDGKVISQDPGPKPGRIHPPAPKPSNPSGPIKKSVPDTKTPQVGRPPTTGPTRVPLIQESPLEPPSELSMAAEAFFKADYQKVVQMLASAKFKEDRANFASRLLLAAAQYTLYLQGGEKDRALRKQAGGNVQACKGLAPLVPSPRVFSPRFIQFFQAPF